MSIPKFNVRLGLLLAFILIMGLLRVLLATKALTPISNFTPIGAMALFGGAYFASKWKAYLFPLLSLFAGDILLMNLYYSEFSNGLLYQGWYWVYGAFALIVFLGQRIIQKVSFKNVALAAILGALLHWILVDGSVWLSGGVDIRTMQPLSRDWAGLMQSYIQGIPFMRNMLISNLVYSGVFFGAYEYLQRSQKVAVQA